MAENLTPQQKVKSDEASLRHFLLAEVMTFVRRARHVPGVRRIALVGSLATDKANPKDADLLVFVDDQADLAALAAAGRKLKGKAQSRNSGADIFLANGSDTYIGRTCHYRDCRPGIRMSCRAMHCGARPHLCDDLLVLTLSVEVVQTPAVYLWPSIVIRQPIPSDLKAMLAVLGTEQSTPTVAPRNVKSVTS